MPKRKTATRTPATKGVRVWVWKTSFGFHRISRKKPEFRDGVWLFPDALVVCDESASLLRAIGIIRTKRTPTQYIIPRAVRVEESK